MLTMIRKTLDLFERRERWQLIGLCVVIVFVALVQTIGVASIMPFMSLVSNPDMVTENARMRSVFDALGFESTRSFLLFVGIAVLGLMAFSNAITAFEHWLMLRFVWRKQHRLSVRLLSKYLHEPYDFYLNQNTSGLAKNILTEVLEVINGVLMPAIKTLAQLLVIVSVLSLLVLVDPQIALAATIVLGGGYGVIYALVRRGQNRLGKVRRHNLALRFKTAAEALGSIKETKVLGREAEFLRRFSASDRKYSEAIASNAIVRDMPRFALETIAFGGILLIVLYLLRTRDDFGQAVAVMSLYALAGYRLMPALQQVFRGVAQIRFFRPALDNLHADLQERSPRPGPRAVKKRGEVAIPLPFERSIVLDRVAYAYPGGETDVLKSVDLEIRKNTSVAFVGRTGSGKSTLVDILLGLLEPRQGTIRVDDAVVSPETVASWRRHLGYVPQQIYLCDDTLARNIALGVPDDEIDHAAVQRAARIAHLHEFIATMPLGYETVIGERGVRLSGGQRQRIGIARALYHDPDVLVMDEATSALDGITEDAVIQAIKDLARQKTIVLVAHRLTTVRDCDAIYMFDGGEIVASGTYDELMKTNLSFRSMAREAMETGTAVPDAAHVTNAGEADGKAAR
jgi:ABC-type multidrug transport system fused ATPase/permease subunit